MRSGIEFGLLLAGVVAWPIAAGAQERAPVCAAPAAPPVELAGWQAPVTAQAAGRESQTSRARLQVGTAARLALLQTPQVRYRPRPEKPGGTVSYGGLVRLDIRQAGTYRIALGTGAWIDLVANGRALTSTAHGPGPDCTGIRKMVDFPLTPGRYTLQIAANGEAQTTVLVVRLAS